MNVLGWYHARMQRKYVHQTKTSNRTVSKQLTEGKGRKVCLCVIVPSTDLCFSYFKICHRGCIKTMTFWMRRFVNSPPACWNLVLCVLLQTKEQKCLKGHHYNVLTQYKNGDCGKLTLQKMPLSSHVVDCIDKHFGQLCNWNLFCSAVTVPSAYSINM